MATFNTQAKKIRVLLVANPKTDLGFDRVARIPHLGLSSIVANADNTLCDVTVLDLVVAGNNPRKYLHTLLLQERPDVVGFSCMTFQYAETLALAQITRSVSRDIVVIIGGYHPTVAAESILLSDNDMQFIDIVFRNEGEAAFNAFIKALYKGDDFKNVPNISYRENGSPRHNPSAEVLSLDTIKPPDRSARLLKKGFYLFGNRADIIETSRGCTFNCEFCSIRRMYGKSYRTYPIERVIRDLQNAKDGGARGIFVVDDNVTLDGKRYKALCDAIIEAKLDDMRFFVQAGVRGLSRTPGLIERMVKSGVRWVFLGIENMSQSNLEFLDKNDQFKNDEVPDVVSKLKKNKIITIGGFIIGNPDDTEESIRANYEYAKKLRLDFALFFILTPFPQTVIREKLNDQKLITNPDDFTQYTCFRACVKTKYLTSEKLFALREELGFRYPFDSGSFWGLTREFVKHPFHYTFRLGLGQLMRDPGEVLGYLRGLNKSK